MSIGLLALLDDVAAIAKVAAASLDDVVGQAAKAGVKAAGVVIDDAAVTPRYVVGFSSKRELPIVAKIAVGSLRNKLLILLPAALALSYFLPWAITPLLMIGGAYLCYEGVEKVYEIVVPHDAHAHEAQLGTVALNPQSLEDEKVAGAIKTDFILSAEIMAITLAAVPDASFWTQAFVLAVVGIGITGRGLWRGRFDREGGRCRRGARQERECVNGGRSEPRRSGAPSFSACRVS